MRNGQNGRRRGRGGPGGSGGGPRTPSGGRSPDMGNSRNEVRVRGNAHQLLEKYKQLARDASMQGDRVSAEYYLQYADHYYRVLNEFRARQEEQQARQQNNSNNGNQPRNREDRDERDYRDGNDGGDDYGDDDGDDMIENAAPMRVSEMTRMIPEPQAEAPAAKGDDDRDGGDRNGGTEASDGNAGGETEAGEGEEGAPRRRRARGRGRPRRETADEGELTPVDA